MGSGGFDKADFLPLKRDAIAASRLRFIEQSSGIWKSNELETHKIPDRNHDDSYGSWLHADRAEISE